MILNTIDEIMGHMERGDFGKDAVVAFREVLTALHEQDGGAGAVTLKFKFKGKGQMVSIATSIDTTIPKRERKTSTAFITADGRLSLQHPDQVDMFADRRRSAVDA
jgi:hypothetical protein